MIHTAIVQTGEITMVKIALPLLSGLAIGLAFGLTAGSLSMRESTDSPEKKKKETLYQGQATTYWIGQLNDRDPSFRKEAMWALAQLGPENEDAVRALEEMLKHPSEGV